MVPYFEVSRETNDPRNTLVEIYNTSATAVLAHVTLWTDVGIPAHTFNVYLTGYDQQTLNLREILIGGLPRTASAGQDPTNTISRKGVFSQDINFASCSGQLPDGAISSVPPDLFRALSGQAAPDIFAGQCGGRNVGDGLARGFITIDTVNNCTVRGPNELGYFGPGGTGDATNQNVLVADYHIFDAVNRRLLSESAVHLQALSTLAPGSPTFYGFAGSNGSDQREPLPSEFRGKFAQARTTLLYWRQPTSIPNVFACGGTGPNLANGQFQVAGFSASGATTPAATGNFFPDAAGIVSGAALNLSSTLGSFDVNLNLPDGSPRQAWVLVRQVPTSAPSNADYGYMTEAAQIGNN
ncbi:hypothetical protein C7S18_03800 [Ahniella affigens]|uniref:Uncharacterized protein n=1 Tax=Ahniella affigens TaxID=2021234 RepID=A0A2P1PNG4_9GAMM|nr:hypothetical protein C7S18_03800 [Ahniella affigens]